MRVTTFFLLSTTLIQTLAWPFKEPENLEGNKKIIISDDEDSQEDYGMEEDDKISLDKLGIINIQNFSKRPFVVICWNHRDQEEREPNLEPMEVYEIKFDRQSNLFWDCSVTSIDESAYTQKLKKSISKRFRAWTNTNYPPYMTQGSQSSIEKAAIAPGLFCNNCYWMLKDNGIYHIYGDYSNANNQYIFIFFWDIRGHKRVGDPLYSGRNRMEVDTKNIPMWFKEVDEDTSHFTKQIIEEDNRQFNNIIKFANKQEDGECIDEDEDENKDEILF